MLYSKYEVAIFRLLCDFEGSKVESHSLRKSLHSLEGSGHDVDALIWKH